MFLRRTAVAEIGMETTVLTVSTCSLNQFALDFDGNRQRIMEAVEGARAAGSCYLITPELSITGSI